MEYTIDDEKYASFMDDGKQHDLAESLCAAGYGIAETRASPALQELLQTYTQAMNEAKQNRLGIWRYGDILGDDKL